MEGGLVLSEAEFRILASCSRYALLWVRGMFADWFGKIEFETLAMAV